MSEFKFISFEKLDPVSKNNSFFSSISKYFQPKIKEYKSVPVKKNKPIKIPAPRGRYNLDKRPKNEKDNFSEIILKEGQTFSKQILVTPVLKKRDSKSVEKVIVKKQRNSLAPAVEKTSQRKISMSENPKKNISFSGVNEIIKFDKNYPIIGTSGRQMVQVVSSKGIVRKKKKI
jgi:hypothetical protein